MGSVMFNGLIPPVEAVATLVAMPVSRLEFLDALDAPHNVTPLTAPQNFET